MARSWFGGTTGDITGSKSAEGYLKLAPATVTAWSAATGGTQYTDLIVDGAPASSIPSDADGDLPRFQGPNGVTELWVGVGTTGKRRLLTTPGAGGAVTSVNGSTGAVNITPASIGAATTAALDAKLSTVGVSDLPAPTVLSVIKSGSTWGPRPSASTSVFVIWVGASPGPAQVSSGTGGMYATDIWFNIVAP